MHWALANLYGILESCTSILLQSSTERRHDPLTIMDGMGRIVSIRSGRDWSDWSAELRFGYI